MVVLSLSLPQAYAQATTPPLTINAYDQQQILRDAGIRKVGSHYVATGCADHLQVTFEPVDLNNDGKAEVILRVFGSSCFSGLMQSNVAVYVKSPSGKWRDTLGFLPAFNVRIQTTHNRGYADIALTVLGGCDPLFHWTGGSYNYASQIPAYDGKVCHADKP